MGCAVQFFKIRVKHHRGRELHQEQDARSRTIMFQHRKSRDLHRKLGGWGGRRGGRRNTYRVTPRIKLLSTTLCRRSWRFYIGFFPFPFLLKTFFHPANCPSLGRPIPYFVFQFSSLFRYSPTRYSWLACNSVDRYIWWMKIRRFEMIIYFEKQFFNIGEIKSVVSILLILLLLFCSSTTNKKLFR